MEAVLARLEALDTTAWAVLVIGHEPLLSALVSATIGGGRIRLAKGALAKVGGFASRIDGELEWLVTPAVIAPGLQGPRKKAEPALTGPTATTHG